MTCRNCKGHWCWICGQEIENANVAWHYNEDNPNSGCFHFAEADSHPDVEATREARRLRLLRLAKVRRPLNIITYPIKSLISLTLGIFFLICIAMHLVLYPPAYGCIRLCFCCKETAPNPQEGLFQVYILILLIPGAAALLGLHYFWLAICIFIWFPLIFLVQAFATCQSHKEQQDNNEIAAIAVEAKAFLWNSVRRSCTEIFEGMTAPTPTPNPDQSAEAAKPDSDRSSTINTTPPSEESRDVELAH